jgi:hypothetical protein
VNIKALCVMENEVFFRNSDLSPQSIELLRNSLRYQFKNHLDNGLIIEQMEKESILTIISYCKNPDLILQILNFLP